MEGKKQKCGNTTLLCGDFHSQYLLYPSTYQLFFSTLGIQMIICSHELLKRYSAQFPCIWVFIPLLNLYSILDLKGNVIGFAFWEGCLEYSKSIIFLLLVGGKIPRISSGHHVVLPLPFYPTFYSLSPSSGVSVIPPC